jgi:hypothetical protein
MDYGKSGAMNLRKNVPHHRGKKAPGPEVQPTGRATKEELLAQMKAAVAAKKVPDGTVVAEAKKKG